MNLLKYKLSGFILGLALVFCFAGRTEAQISYKDRKLYLNQDGSSYVKLTFLTQGWLRYQQYNPGTTIFGYSKDKGPDIGIRRYRIQLYAQITDRIFIYSQFGENNFNAIADRKLGFFVHDATAEYALDKKRLSLGLGLTGWNGLSRFTSPSIGTIMGIDAPLYLQSTNDVTDQFLRKLSLYAKGKLGKLDYRLVMSHPMAIQKSANYNAAITNISSFSAQPPKMQWHGYLQYQLFDEESNLIPYNTGTYLGKKKVLNFGIGALYQHDAMWHMENNDTVSSNLFQVSADVFYDAPVGSKGAAISAYGNVAYYNYGKDYVRNLGPMNPANGDADPAILNGGGNSFPMYGTGTTLYGQLGYKLRDSLIGNTTLMPYIAVQNSRFERLHQPVNFVDVGMNWLLPNHMSKLTLSYQNRPVYNTDGDLTTRKNALVIQYQVNLN